LIDGLSIDEVAFFQAVKIDVVKAGGRVAKGVRNAQVVAGREALVRVFVKPGAGFTARSVVAELRLVGPDGTEFPVIRDTKKISVASTDAVAASTLNLEVPGESLPKGVTWSVALRDGSGAEATASDNSAAQYPHTGVAEALDNVSTGDVLKVVVVPVQYGADGSNRVPDVTAAQLETYRQEMYAYYPAAKVEVTARAPFAYTKTIAATGSGFSTILQAIVALREQDNAADDVYYYGALAPATTFAAYCHSSCVTGLSGVGQDPGDAQVRASVGIGFTGPESAKTMAHEVGHAHGREHSPCGGASGPDPAYPYSGGAIGVWGYNIVTKEFFSPTTGKDIMGYCQPEWISDYTYQALVKRMQAVNGAQDFHGAIVPSNYRFVNVENGGNLTWGDSITMRRAPMGEEHPMTFLAANGSVLATGVAHYYRYDHVPGGYLLVPKARRISAKSRCKVSPSARSRTWHADPKPLSLAPDPNPALVGYRYFVAKARFLDVHRSPEFSAAAAALDERQLHQR